MVVNMFLLKAAIVLMLIFIVKEILQKKFGIDMDKIDVTNLKNIKNQIKPVQETTIVKNTGERTLILKDAGTNKATVMATLRQITGLDYNTAKNIVNSAPSTIMTKISDEEADLTRKALEYVGATIEVK